MPCRCENPSRSRVEESSKERQAIEDDEQQCHAGVLTEPPRDHQKTEKPTIMTLHTTTFWLSYIVSAVRTPLALMMMMDLLILLFQQRFKTVDNSIWDFSSQKHTQTHRRRHKRRLNPSFSSSIHKKFSSSNWLSALPLLLLLLYYSHGSTHKERSQPGLQR